jgi:hypothetical protein
MGPSHVLIIAWIRGTARTEDLGSWLGAEVLFMLWAWPGLPEQPAGAHPLGESSANGEERLPAVSKRLDRCPIRGLGLGAWFSLRQC